MLNLQNMTLLTIVKTLQNSFNKIQAKDNEIVINQVNQINSFVPSFFDTMYGSNIVLIKSMQGN